MEEEKEEEKKVTTFEDLEKSKSVNDPFSEEEESLIVSKAREEMQSGK